MNTIKIITLMLTLCLTTSATAERYAGVRMSEYGPAVFPAPTQMGEYAYNMSQKSGLARPAVILVVGVIQEDRKTCKLVFPYVDKTEDFSSSTSLATNKSTKNIAFVESDRFDAYLTYFDEAGVDVFLQVEPGNASVLKLIRLTLDRYAHHPSVVGFGVDVEWYRAANDTTGSAVTNLNAVFWESVVKSYNNNYQLFLKHWLMEKMPASYRGDIVFVDDSQGFNSLRSMENEFRQWKRYFSNNPVFFQVGYEADQSWWGEMGDPTSAIALSLWRIDREAGIFWVDFTIDELIKNFGW